MVLLRKGGRSTGTVNHYVKFLRHMMRVMVRPKAWVIELWADVRLDKSESKIPHILTTEQEDRLLEALPNQDALRVCLATILGIRLTQFFSLRWEWVSWKNRALSLPPFKRHPARTLPLPTGALLILERSWTEQGQPEQGWVFQAKGFRARPVNAHNWYNRHYSVAVRKAGLDGLKVTFTPCAGPGPAVPARRPRPAFYKHWADGLIFRWRNCIVSPSMRSCAKPWNAEPWRARIKKVSGKCRALNSRFENPSSNS